MHPIIITLQKRKELKGMRRRGKIEGYLPVISNASSELPQDDSNLKSVREKANETARRVKYRRLGNSTTMSTFKSKKDRRDS